MTIRTRLNRLAKALAGTNGTKPPRRGFARPVVELLETRLVPASLNQVVTVANANGLLETFKIDSNDTQVWHDWQQKDQNGNLVWSGWQTLGSPSGNNLKYLSATINNVNGTLEVFVTDSPLVGADQVYRINQSTAGGIWTSWQSMGGIGDNIIGGMDVGQNVQDGRLEVFVLVADDFHVRHMWQTSAAGSWSNGWADMGDPAAQFGMSVTKIVVAQNAVTDPNNQGLDVFALCHTQTGTYLAESRQSNNASTWSPWTAMPSGGLTSTKITDFAVGQNQNNYLQVFVATWSNNSSQVFTDQQQGLGGIWQTWSSVGTPNAGQQLTLHVARNQTNDNYNGTLEVVASDGTNLYQMAQQGKNTNIWGAWGSLWRRSGSAVASFAIGQNQDGRLEVFVITSDTNVYHAWQGWPAGSWSSWNQL